MSVRLLSVAIRATMQLHVSWLQRVLLEPTSHWRLDLCRLQACPFVNAGQQVCNNHNSQKNFFFAF